ncbi:MAG: hypothetical protein ACJ704_04200 [Nitrososphaeraceae archaeon]
MIKLVSSYASNILHNIFDRFNQFLLRRFSGPLLDYFPIMRDQNHMWASVNLLPVRAIMRQFYRRIDEKLSGASAMIILCCICASPLLYFPDLLSATA